MNARRGSELGSHIQTEQHRGDESALRHTGGHIAMYGCGEFEGRLNISAVEIQIVFTGYYGKFRIVRL
jgi:hypothetical protein